MREWQVEWMSRPDEREHVVTASDFREACILAKTMSNKHEGTAVVIALDDRPDGDGKHATGHMEFNFGILGERVGVLDKASPAA
jgi:hypothetical protein